MRKWNAVLSMGILVLFLVHAIAGGFQLLGVIPGGSGFLSVLSWIMTALIALHAVIGTILTVQTVRIQKRAGALYLKENRLFWTRRVSGFAVMLLILSHILIFIGKQGEAYRLHPFGAVELVTQVLLVLSIAVHVLTNIRPLMTALGARGWRDFFVDILLVLSVLLFFAGIAFLVYFFRWQQL